MASNLSASHSTKRPTVIGLYGISGCGKSFLLGSMRENLSHEAFDFFEGSEVISDLVPGGLPSFQQMTGPTKAVWRSKAILHIQKKCQQSCRTGVVAGHCMFWPEDQPQGQDVHTTEDMQVFTHIVYLAVDPEQIAQFREHDTSKKRPRVSEDHLRRWQQTEVDKLRDLCRHHFILFSVQKAPVDVQRLCRLMCQFREDTEEENARKAMQQIDDYLSRHAKVRAMLVFDADKTLAEDDAGMLFWEMIEKNQPHHGRENPLKELFGGPLGYSDCAFRQAALLFEDSATGAEYETICDEVAAHIVMHREITALMRLVAEKEHVGIAVVTCGLKRVWETVLEREGLLGAVCLVGGGRTSDSLVVTPLLKALIVGRLRKDLGFHVSAFGDSPLDIPMLVEADEAIVVVGSEKTRSRSMDATLLEKIKKGALKPRQVLLPGDVSLRLDDTLMPRVRLNDPEFVRSLILDTTPADKPSSTHRLTSSGLPLLHATNTCAAKLLMSPMRDASVAGPALREAHFAVGRYLAMEFASKEIGLEEYPIPHVQGHETVGHRLRGEAQTTIVALMRGGEAMALGVNHVFPTAMFLHASSPGDVKDHHLRDQKNLVLVDSVINSGQTIREFAERVRALGWRSSVLVVSGVVQADALVKLEDLAGQLSIVALRRSENKFTGTKGTDTGNRLYNTTHLA